MGAWGIPAVAVWGVLRAGYRFAERREWLPASVYRQRALKCLKDGDLPSSARYNRIALAKRPDAENALVIRDLLAMRRDALLRNLETRIEKEHRAINDIHLERDQYRNRRRRLRWIHGLLTYGLSVGAGGVPVFLIVLTLLDRMYLSLPVIIALALVLISFWFWSWKGGLEALQDRIELSIREKKIVLDSLDRERLTRSRRLQDLTMQRDHLETLNGWIDG
jgi:hypothetical protein